MAKGRDPDVDHACKVRPRQLWPCSAAGFLVLITVPAAAAAVGLLMSDDLLSGVDSERNHFHLFNLNNHLGNGNHTDGQGGSADHQKPQEAPCGGGGDTPNYKPPWGWSASVKTVPELIRSYGYPAEEHKVTTSRDGYILTLHRIPPRDDPEGAGGPPSRGAGIPVLLGHCLFGSSAIWTFGPTNHSLAYLLADEGYDVWMINVRGNQYSKAHTDMKACPTCTDFWSFDFHDSTLDDYTSTIDYILAETGHSGLHFVGYSMGTTQYLVLLSERPEYNRKVLSGHLLGAVALGSQATNPLVSLVPYGEIIAGFLEGFGFYELLPNFLDLKGWLAHTICSGTLSRLKLCSNFFATLVGAVPEHLNASMVVHYLTHMPAGSNTRTVLQLSKLFNNKASFLKHDHGTLKNLAKYGSPQPGEYDLTKVEAPTAIYSGESDGFSTKPDLDILASLLPNVIAHHHLDSRHRFAHLDFILAVKARHLVYDRIIETLNAQNLIQLS